MNLNILNANFEKVKVIDTYASLIWCKRFYEVGALDLEIEASVENINLFRKGFYITRDDDDAIFRIEAIEIDTEENGDDKLIIGAVDCKAILNQRITWEQVFVRNETVENFIKAMLNANFINPADAKRKISNFVQNIQPLTTERTTRQSTYDLIGDKIIELCMQNEIGCKITLNENNQFVFSLYKGVDRSSLQDQNPRLIFSPNFENLFSSKYNYNMSEYKNVALVGGEGEGLERKLRSVGDARGIERREMFVDAGSASNDGGDLADYYEALINEGKDKLAETAATTSFEGEVDSQNSYRYKTDYQLGDLVSIENKYGISATARIVEVIETWDNEGYTVEPKFEYVEENVDISEVIFTEDSDPILTENYNALQYETSPFVVENGSDYIITEDNQFIVLEDVI